MCILQSVSINFSVSLASADVHDISSIKSTTSMSDFKNAVMSKSALTHRFKKADDPNRCRECDNNVYFHGVECEVVCVYVNFSILDKYVLRRCSHNTK